MKIGIFGGSFNQPHKMHYDIAINLLEKHYVDKIIYVPTGKLYNKKNLESNYDRYKMLKLMVQNISNVLVSNYEFGALKYTYQTLNYFHRKYPNDEIYFICGSDNLKTFNTWMRYKYILNNYKLLVIKRNDDNIDEIINRFQKFKNNIVIANINLNNISSTKIRDLLNKGEMIPNNMLNIKVLNYIQSKQLYIKQVERRDE